ncbi:hypothetical protein K501DRAFT_280552 [Backusella circina FSU 941]|nr:hypothetical protein K501DRAFT_280552 [Backusella circina FSU 941]
MDSFNNEVEFCLKKKIRVSINNDENIQELPKSCQSLTGLNKEKGASLTSSSWENQQAKKKKKGFEYWNEYAKNNFDRLLEEVGKEDQDNSAPFGKNISNQASPAPSSSIASDKQSAINTTPNETVTDSSNYVICLIVKVCEVMLVLNENSF